MILLEKVVSSLISNYKPEGLHSVSWDASSMPSGIYFVQLNVEGNIDTQKIMLIK